MTDTAEVPKESNLDSLEILAEVARQTHTSSPKAVEVSQPKLTIHFNRRRSDRQYLAKQAAETSKVSGDDILMPDADTLQENAPTCEVSAEKINDDTSPSADTIFVAGKEYVVYSDKPTSVAPMSKDIPSAASADIEVECPNSVPPEAISTQKVKGKSILIEPTSPPREKSKEELANEKLSELVAAHLQAKEDAVETKNDLDMKASEALAKKIQAYLDRMGTPFTTTLPAERKKELDELAKSLSA